MADSERDMKDDAASQTQPNGNHADPNRNNVRRAWVEPEFVAMDLISAEIGGSL